MKILVAVDGSPFTQRMLAYIVEHGDWLGSKHPYTVLYVAPAVPSRAAAALDRQLLKEHYAEEAEKVFAPIRSFLEQHQIQADYVGKVGPAGDVIAEVADQGRYDLLMMGSHGHGTLGKLVLGSVSTKVMAHCHTPVLVIR
jgi:nucleotide-binding universal stress UspA family protein